MTPYRILLCIVLLLSATHIAGCAASEPTVLRLHWIPEAETRYALKIHLRPDKSVTLNGRASKLIPRAMKLNRTDPDEGLLFTGVCTNHPDLKPIPLDWVDRFELQRLGASSHSAVVEYAGQARIDFRFPVILRWNAIQADTFQLHALDAAGLERWTESFPAEKLNAVIPAYRLQDVVELRLKAHHGDEAPHDSAGVMVERGQVEYAFDFPTSPYHQARRRLLKAGMADPVLIRGADSFVLAGTHWQDTCRIPFLVSQDLERAPHEAEYQLKTEFFPNKIGGNGYDPEYAYFHLWAPELIWTGARYRLFFSAVRLARPAADQLPPPPPVDDQVTLFVAEAGSDLRVDTPIPFNSGKPGSPQSTADQDQGPFSGTPFQIKIDSAWLEACTPPRLFYTWFHRGNHVASFAPSVGKETLLLHLDPSLKAHEMILEAPYAIAREGRYYLFYSSGHFNCSYATHYLMGETVEGLCLDKTPARPLLDYIGYKKEHRAQSPFLSFASTPLQYKNRYLDHKLLENAGHCGVVEDRGRYYLVYHVGRFRDGLWCGGRDTYISPLVFAEDGGIYPIGF